MAVHTSENVTLFRVVVLSRRELGVAGSSRCFTAPFWPLVCYWQLYSCPIPACVFQSIGDDDAIVNSSQRISYLGVVAARARADKELLRGSQTSNCLAYRSAMF